VAVNLTSRRHVKTLWVREPYLAQILAGHKTVEVRVGYENIRRLQPGDRLKLNDRHLAVIRHIGHYPDLKALMDGEDPKAIAPDLPPAELLAAMREIYPPDKESLGAVALEVAPCRYDAVLSDMGYTLVYFDPPQAVILQEALGAIGVERSVDQILAAMDEVWGEYYRDAATATFPATEEYDRQVEAGLQQQFLSHLDVKGDEAVYQAYNESLVAWFSRPGVLRPYPEVVDVLAALRDLGYRLGIISNWSWNLRARVAQVGLDSFFEVVWGSAYAGYNKPHPAIFQQALAQMDLRPQRVLYVGDSYPHDVIGARGAGMNAVLLDREGKADDPDCPVIRDLWGVFDLLEESCPPFPANPDGQ
jgi:putative hydrolase of the HAD superfamily